MTTDTNLGACRDAFLDRVRNALGGATQGTPEPPRVDEQLARLASPTDDLVAIFTERAKAVGMKVHRVRLELAVGTVVGVLREQGVNTVALAAGTVGDRLGLAEQLTSGGFEIADPLATPGLDAQYDFDAGVTDVHAALAETGTLVCASDIGHSRGPSLVPPIHVALVRRSDVLPDMLDYYARLRGIPGVDLPSSIAFITGPSKTADIEGELITGVHGPGQVHIVLIEDA